MARTIRNRPRDNEERTPKPRRLVRRAIKRSTRQRMRVLLRDVATIEDSWRVSWPQSLLEDAP